MTSTEFAEWMIVYYQEPWDRDTALAAMICATVCNASGNYKKTIDTADFIPDEQKMFGSKKPRIDADQLKHKLKVMTLAMGGTVNGKGINGQ